MAKLLSAYFGRTIPVRDVPAEMRGANLSYPELFWTNTPYFRPAVYQALDELNRVDYSPTYYFRVRQAMRLLAIYRQSPARVRRACISVPRALRLDCAAELAVELCQGRAARGAGRRCAASGCQRALCAAAGNRIRLRRPFRREPDVGRALDDWFGSIRRAPPQAASGRALLRLRNHAHARRLRQLRWLRRGRRPDETEDEASDPLHALGWAFDVPSVGLSKTEQRDLKFILTDLRQAGLLAYVEDGRAPTYHVVRHPDHAARFEQFYWDAMAGNVPAEPPRLASATVKGQRGELTGKLDKA